MKYPTIDDIITIHEKLIQQYGGSQGIRDHGLLASAMHRPQSTVFGEDAYPSLFDKAAAICHSFLFNHPFVDGNKRVAFAACHLTLLANGFNISLSSAEIYKFLIDVIKTHKDVTYISAWLEKHSKKIKP